MPININNFSSLPDKWLEFISSNKWASIFHHPNWIKLIAECYGYQPLVVTIPGLKGEIRAGIPIVEVNSILTGRRWISLPFSDHCAPLYMEERDLQQLIEELVSLSRNPENPRIELRGNYPTHDLIHTHTGYVLHTLKLESGLQALFGNLHPMHRRNIKKAQKSGVRIEISANQKQLDDFYQLHMKNRRRQGIPVQPKKFFNLLQNKLLNQGLGFILSAYLDDECIAAYIFLHWGETLTYKFGASNPERHNLRPNNLMMWEGIRWGCENGYCILDLGRSSISNVGLRRFKNMWGAEETPLTYAFLPARSYSSPNERMERVMNIIIRNTPPWVSRASGELFYRHFA